MTNYNLVVTIFVFQTMMRKHDDLKNGSVTKDVFCLAMEEVISSHFKYYNELLDLLFEQAHCSTGSLLNIFNYAQVH